MGGLDLWENREVAVDPDLIGQRSKCEVRKSGGLWKVVEEREKLKGVEKGFVFVLFRKEKKMSMFGTWGRN